MSSMTFRPSRREVLKAGVAATAGIVGGALPEGLLRGLAAAPTGGRLSDIEHVIFFIQENRAFNHLFGTYPGVNGFKGYSADSSNPDYRRWNQFYDVQTDLPQGDVPPPNPLKPFHIDSMSGGQCTHDIDHQWVTQHKSWNLGQMDKFLATHLDFDGFSQGMNQVSGAKHPNGVMTMGYYERADVPVYYALADNFTLCDAYHTSAISGSAPNWIYAFTGMIDPEGMHGGPIAVTPPYSDYPSKWYGKLTWTTMMERLEANHVSWKFYNSPDVENPVFSDNFLTFFANFFGPSADPTLAMKALGDQNWAGSQPLSFMADCAAGNLPQVSWLIAPAIWSDHPPASPQFGAGTTKPYLPFG